MSPLIPAGVIPPGAKEKSKSFPIFMITPIVLDAYREQFKNYVSNMKESLARLSRARLLNVTAALLSITTQNADSAPNDAEVTPAKTVHSLEGKSVALRGNGFLAGDRVLLPDGPRFLFRRKDSVVVVFREAATRAARMAAEDAIIGSRRELAGFKADKMQKGKTAKLVAPSAFIDAESLAEKLAQLRQLPEVESADPIFVDSASGMDMHIEPEILLKMKPGFARGVVIGPRAVASKLIGCTSDVYAVPMNGATAEAVIAESNRLSADPRVEWAHPNFSAEPKKNQAPLPLPNDPLFGVQWHLENTTSADIGVRQAWGITQGSTEVVVAVLDDGVELNHPDLTGSLSSNPNDPVGGGDQDNNGFVDDNSGWDFVNSDNSAEPANTANTHGTNVAGVIVARINNSQGGAGVAPQCRLLPIRTGGGPISAAGMATAIRYAAGSPLSPGQPVGGTAWRGADVINMSFSYPKFPVIDDGITWAAKKSHDGRGTLVIAASGNEALSPVTAHTFQLNFPQGFVPEGYTLRFRWRYVKNGIASQYDDAVWVDDVATTLFNGLDQNFNGTTFPPAGWTTGASDQANNPIAAPWNRSNQIGRFLTTASARSGVIGDNQQTFLQRDATSVTAASGFVFFNYWTSAEFDQDILTFDVIDPSNGNTIFTENLSHREVLAGTIEYPASHPDSFAVGATDDRDLRSTYSQWGPGLDLVAPGGAHLTEMRVGIVTTDRVGSVGYAGDYTATTDLLAGTSFAAPVAAGVAGLMYSAAVARGFTLTSGEVGIILRASCDKIGGVTFTGGEGTGDGYNSEYGYGRILAPAAVENVFYSKGSLPGWTGSDITPLGMPLAYAGSNRLFDQIGMRSVRTSGRSLANAGFGGGIVDQCTFLNQSLSGNSQIVARVNSVAGTSNEALTGLMIRDGTNTGAKHATVALTGDGKAVFKRRAAVGGATTTTTVNAVAPPYWLRLIRSSNSVTAARSVDGTTWTNIGTATLTTAATYNIGIIGSNGTNTATSEAELGTCTLTNLNVQGPQIITTFVGNGNQTSTGNGGLATLASIGPGGGMAFDSAGNLFVSDEASPTIRKIDAITGIITNAVGSGVFGFADGPAATAQFSKRHA